MRGHIRNGARHRQPSILFKEFLYCRAADPKGIFFSLVLNFLLLKYLLDVAGQATRLMHQIGILDSLIKIDLLITFFRHTLNQLREFALLLEILRLLPIVLLLPPLHGLQEDDHEGDVAVLFDGQAVEVVGEGLLEELVERVV